MIEKPNRRMAPAAVGLSVTVSVEDVDPEALFARYGAACGRTPWIVGGASVTGRPSASHFGRPPSRTATF